MGTKGSIVEKVEYLIKKWKEYDSKHKVKATVTECVPTIFCAIPDFLRRRVSMTQEHGSEYDTTAAFLKAVHATAVRMLNQDNPDAGKCARDEDTPDQNV